MIGLLKEQQETVMLPNYGLFVNKKDYLNVLYGFICSKMVQNLASFYTIPKYEII